MSYSCSISVAAGDCKAAPYPTITAGRARRRNASIADTDAPIIGLEPMLWATGTGAEIVRPMAAPVLGGLLISDEVIDLRSPFSSAGSVTAAEGN